MKVKTGYKVFKRRNDELFWKREESLEERKNYASLEQLNNFLKHYNREDLFEGGFKLVNEKIKKNGTTIYKFLSVPHADSACARNPGKYRNSYLSIKIVPVISLDNLEK